MRSMEGLWIGPSLMCADQGNLYQDVEDLEKAGVDFLHLDIMDGNFVENLAMSPDAVLALRKRTKLFCDVHLMLKRPLPYIGRFAEMGVDLITVHAESEVLLPVVLERIHSLGILSGVAINPRTPASVIEPFLKDIDVVCVMSVEPGFAGQKFIEDVLPKIDVLSEGISKAGARTRIEIDGNVTFDRLPDLVSRGVSMFVGGTSMIFRKDMTFPDALAKARKVFQGVSFPNEEDIIVIGSIMMDLVSHCKKYPVYGESVVGEGFRIIPGGKGANQAIACSRMGASVSLIGAVGGDAFADLALSGLSTNRVDISNVERILDADTGTALITIDANAENTIVVNKGANDLIGGGTIGKNEGAFCGVKGLMLQLELPLPVVESAMRMAKKHGVFILLDPGPARDVPNEILQMADLITPNYQETLALTGIDVKSGAAAIEAAKVLIQRGSNQIVIKRGSAGCVVYSGGVFYEITGISVDVVDTVGAGDCFAGAFMARWLEDGNLIASCRFANAAAALKVQRAGAQAGIPSRREVDEMMVNMRMGNEVKILEHTLRE